MTLGYLHYDIDKHDLIERIINDFNINLKERNITFLRSYSADNKSFSLSISGDKQDLERLLELLPKPN